MHGVFSANGQSPRVGVAIGDQVLDLAALDDAGLLPAPAKGTFASASLNRFIALGQPVWQGRTRPADGAAFRRRHRAAR